MEVNYNLVALAVSTLIILMGLAAAWGSLLAQVKGIHRRQDVSNGHLVDHERRISRIEGSHEHGGD